VASPPAIDAADGRRTTNVIVNHCAVNRGGIERKARQAIGAPAARRPDARIIVNGCAAQIEPQRFAAIGDDPRRRNLRKVLERNSKKT